MVDLDSKDGVQILRDAIEESARYIKPRINMAVEASDAYQSKMPVLSTDDVNLDVNYLKPIIKRFAAQHSLALDGERPYIPLSVNLAEEKAKGKAYEEAIDEAIEDAGYTRVRTSLWYWTLCYGDSFNQISWESYDCREKKRSPFFDEYGQFQGFQEEISESQKDNLCMEAVPFWQMGFPAAGTTLLQKDWAFRWSIKSVNEIMRMIDLGRFPSIPKHIDRKFLRANSHDNSVAYAKHFNQQLGMGAFDSTDEDIGILYEFFSADRWVVVWNLNVDLDPKNHEPRLYNVDKRTKPFAQLKLPSGVGGDQFWGEGLWEQIRDKALIANLLTSLHAQHAVKDAMKIKLVDTRAFDEETLKRVGYGDMLEYDGSMLPNGTPPIDVLDQGKPDSSLLDLSGFVRERVEDTVNEPAIARAQSPSPKQTATGMGILQQNLAPLQSFLTSFSEGTYKREFADLVISLYSTEASYTAFAMAVGFERAQMAMTPDPYSGIYGGFKPRFEGADRVGAKAVRFEKFLQFYNFASAYFQQLVTMAQDPNLAQLAMQRMEALFRSWEQFVEGLPDKERAIIFTDQAAMMPAPMPAMGPEGAPMEAGPNAQVPPNQIKTPILNQEVQGAM